MTYIPIHVHTCWSLLDSTLSVSELVSECIKLKIPAICLTDHNNIKALVPFYKECKAGGIKPIIGVELDIYEGIEFLGRITLLAKNKTGYQNIVKLVSLARTKDALSHNGNPRTQFTNLYSYSSGLICLIGDIKSEIYTQSYINADIAYLSTSDVACQSLIREDWNVRVEQILAKYRKIYHAVHLYYSLSFLPCSLVLGKKIKETFKQALPSNNIHYLNKEDRELHGIVTEQSDKTISDCEIFKIDKPNCHLFSSIPDGEKTLFLMDLVEDYEIKSKPMLPSYKISSHKLQDQHNHLYELCKKGFVSTGLSDYLKTNPALKDIYIDRIKHELGVFKQADISGYFLMVNDIIDSIRKLGIPADIRGSSSGCIISYLLGMSSIDPLRPDPTLEYNEGRVLPFERFYNEGRNTEGNVSLPDIDTDVPPHFRNNVIEYLREKYGNDCVGHIITHSRFRGKGAIKEMFKLLKPVADYFNISNEITKKFVDESKIADDLFEMQKEDPSYGIIRWNIDNIKSVEEYYEQYKTVFDMAIKIEQLPKNESVHAAGIIVADQPLSGIFPMTYSEKLDQMVIDIEGTDIEYLGGVKLDILGVSALEKVYQIQRMINANLDSVTFGEIK